MAAFDADRWQEVGMSAAELRKAAETLRARAGAAHPGPWYTDKYDADGVFTAPEVTLTSQDVAFASGGLSRQKETDAYIATMHPGVGLALADWLDLTARRLDEGLYVPGDYQKPLALARLINGDPA